MKTRVYFLLSVLGCILIAAGLYYVKAWGEPRGMGSALPYCSIGIGCGAFGHGVGELVRRRALRSAPDIEKQLEIEQKDERNIAVSNRAKGKAYDAMLYIFGALLVALALMGTALHIILLFVFAYLFVVGISIFYRSKYEKEM